MLEPARPRPEILVNCHSKLGENPYWDPKARQFYWTDITGGMLWRHDTDSGLTTRIYQGPTVGGFTQEADGALLLFRINDVGKLADDGSVAVVARFSEPGNVRFNDVIADPRGRVFAGTIGETATSGGLYCFDLDGSVRRMIGGTGCSNGMAFTANHKQFYWTCSTRRQIWRYDYDEESGGLANGQLWYQADTEEGTPDGLTIDLEGNIWSARWDGHCVRKHASEDGRVLEEHRFPVAQVSAVAFAGPTMDTLYCTTAGGDGRESLEGAVFTLRVPHAQGRAEFKSRLAD